ncbi:MAG: TerB family tellurite resistance protein [Lentisphaerae bacterium]|nr:TerB family tellurite resistance protein [Lentisphaerota bacterium]MCP4102019.1 TerB family tellurite resistance protein [Lentisphaerota bacterium]
MDFAFLPEKIKQQLSELEPQGQPVCVVRGSGGFNGAPGESYIIPYSSGIYLFDRKFSEREFFARKALYMDITELTLDKEQFSAILLLCAGEDERVRVKLSKIEAENAVAFMEFAQQYPEIQELVVDGTKEATEIEGICPKTGLLALLMFVSSADDKIADEEQQYFTKLCDDDTVLYNNAKDFYEKMEYEELIDKMNIDRQQKLCFLANMFEIAMSDGVLSSKEQKLIDFFIDRIDIEDGDAETVREVLLLKNQLSAL